MAACSKLISCIHPFFLPIPLLAGVHCTKAVHFDSTMSFALSKSIFSALHHSMSCMAKRKWAWRVSFGVVTCLHSVT